MISILRLPVCALGLCTALLAGPAEDKAVLERHRIQQVAPLALETTLVADAQATACIVPADDPATNAAAARLQAAITVKTGVTLPIIAAKALGKNEWEHRNLIVIGNMLTNPAYARLYNNFFVCADAGYTGVGGFELRTVHNPWGTGRNVVALGAQEASGLMAGADRLIGEINAHGRLGQLALGRLMILSLMEDGRRAPLLPQLTSEEIALEKSGKGTRTGKTGSDVGGGQRRQDAYRTVRYAMLYHRTGDRAWLELFRQALQVQMDYYRTDPLILEEGPRRYDRDFRDSWAWRLIVAWDLVEEDPTWTDLERLQVTNHLLRLIFECNMKNGWDSAEAIQRWMKYDSVPHNHQTWPGLANLFGGWYFKRHYQMPLADTWLEIATRMFRSASRSAKAWEDAAGYDWVVPLHILTYAFAAGDHKFIADGHAAELADALIMSVDTLGHQPAWGDCEFVADHYRIPELLGAIGQATGDGRIRWLEGFLGVDARGELEEPRWTAVEPHYPADHVGLRIRYLPKAHFNLLGSRELGSRNEFRAPNLPYEATFDKLVLRDGWSAGDDYLMLDGYAAGSHGHNDGNAIISYVSQGCNWLTDAEYISRLPKHHSAVTVQRNGVSSVMPTNARLETAVWFGDGALVRSSMPHYNGITWTRSIVHVAKSYLAVIDEMTAEQAGDYVLRCGWRVLGEATLHGDSLSLRQHQAGFTLKNLSGQAQELVYVRNSGEHTYYEEPGQPIHHLYQREARYLQAGETVRFVNVMRAAHDGVPAINAWSTGALSGAIVINGRPEIFGVDGRCGRLVTDARVYRVGPDAAWLAGVTVCDVDGKSLLHLPNPASVRIDGRGMALGKPQPVPEAGLQAAVWMGASVPLPETFDVTDILATISHQPATGSKPATDPYRDLTALPVQWDFPAFVAGQTTNGRTADRLRNLASIDLDDDNKPDAVLGSQAGELIAVSAYGVELWRRTVDGPVTALAVGRLREGGEPLVVYGTKAATLAVLNCEGRELARIKPPDFRGVTSRVRTILLADLEQDGSAEIIAGCDSWQYVAYDLADSPAAPARELRLRWQGIFYAHSATVAQACDLNADGKLEIVAGNEYFQLQLLDHQGKIMAGSPSFGPGQTAVAACSDMKDGRSMVFAGTDGGDVAAFDATARLLWQRNVGDRITSLLVDRIPGRVIAASEGGAVWCLDDQGGVAWNCELGSPVKRMARGGNGYVAVTLREVFLLTADGRKAARCPLPSAAEDLVVGHDLAFVLMPTGILRAVRLH